MFLLFIIIHNIYNYASIKVSILNMQVSNKRLNVQACTGIRLLTI